MSTLDQGRRSADPLDFTSYVPDMDVCDKRCGPKRPQVTKWGLPPGGGACRRWSAARSISERSSRS